jgi:hypothetical protein
MKRTCFVGRASTRKERSLTGRDAGLGSPIDKIDSEIYPLKLEEASGKEPENWNMERYTSDRSLDYVSLPISGEEQTIVPELGPTVPVSRQAGG